MREGWKVSTIGDAVRIASGQVDPKDEAIADLISVGPDNLVSGGGIDESGLRTARDLVQISGKYAFDQNAILYSKIRPNLNKAALPAFNGICSADMYPMWVVDPARTNREFIYYVLTSERFVASATSRSFRTGLPKINREDLEAIEINLPPLPEQRKIAEILRTWDEALEKLTALRTAKVRRISSLRQRLFEAEYASHNRLQRAKDLFETVSERGRTDLPLLAVMQDIGIVRRDELDRRVAMPDGDTSTYKVVRPGDFVISLRSFEGGLEYSSIIGLVSPAYTVLRPTADLIGDYYRHFFKSRSFIGRLDKLIFGIRDGKQIAFRDFGDMYIPAPPFAEQEAHARALGSLEADLALEDERIATLIRQKRGLMQKLLTGEWRVATAETTEVAQ